MSPENLCAETSFIHNLDPRVRLGIALFSALCIVSLRNPETAALILCFSCLLPWRARIPYIILLKRLFALNLFMLFLWLTLLPSGGMAGGALALMATLKSNALLMLLLSLLSSMNPAVLGCALERLGCPTRLVFLLIFTYRYLQTAAEEWRRLFTAAKLRAFTPRWSLHSYKALGYMLGMLFVQSFDRAVRTREAMLLRAFNGVFHTVAGLRVTTFDLFFALLWCAIFATVAACDFFYAASTN